jgi:hypothetical protein
MFVAVGAVESRIAEQQDDQAADNAELRAAHAGFRR